MMAAGSSLDSPIGPRPAFSTPLDPNFRRLSSLRRFPSSTVHYEPFAHGSDRRLGKVAKLLNLQVRLTAAA
jgi:hypothetical protein